MSSVRIVHKIQVSILESLRHATRARYSELLLPTGVESDAFKYHLRRLAVRGYVYKADDGAYELTAEGKEFADRLDGRTGRELEQPKASILLVVRSNGKYLAHRRTREPFRDFWGIASAPMLRGVPIRDGATRELRKQTGITANFSVVGLYRVTDTLSNGTVLEDKLFSVMVADIDGVPAPHTWYGGESQWLTRDELLAKSRLFPTTAKTLDMIEQGEVFIEDICIYTNAEY